MSILMMIARAYVGFLYWTEKIGYSSYLWIIRRGDQEYELQEIDDNLLDFWVLCVRGIIVSPTLLVIRLSWEFFTGMVFSPREF